jgi:hypothetical protein
VGDTRNRSRTDVLRRLAPQLHDGTWAFTSIPPDTDLAGLDVVATMREREGLTLVVPEAQARARGFPIALRCAWITMTASTSLDETGITAAFARVLADAGIPCNVIAGAHHDHVFVPVERAREALQCLTPGRD